MGIWTCPECERRFANTHQWHSCIELSLESALAGASDQARGLYQAVADAMAACGEFRIHPQKSRIAFITIMTFAGVKLARRWVDVSLITAEPIDDPRIERLECYGPTSFAHTIRVTDPAQLDPTVREWLCRAWRRGNRETLDPGAHVQPLAGRALELVLVPLRALVVERADDLALAIPRYAAEVFADHPTARAKIGGTVVTGAIEADGEQWTFSPLQPVLRELGAGSGDTVDAFLRADI